MLETLQTALGWLDQKFEPATGPANREPCPNGDGEFVLVRDGYEIHEFPGRRRRVCRHRFEDLETFANWLNARADAKETDILLGEQEVVADLDPHANHADVVECSLRYHPRLERWWQVFGKPMKQKAFHRLVVSSPEDFETTPLEKGGEVGQGELLAMQIGKLHIAKEGNYQSDIDERGTIRFAASSDKTEVTGELPPRFDIRVPFFVGVFSPGAENDGEILECTYTLEIHLDLDASGDVPMFELSCPALPVVARTALLDARAWLEDRLDAGFMVGIGVRKDVEVPAP